MSTVEASNENEIEDLEICAKEGKVPHGKSRLKILVNDKQFVIDDPVPTGRQILDLAGLRPVEEHLLFQFLLAGQLEEILLDETTDLRKPGIERFITFKSDRSFRFLIDGRQFEWGASEISGFQLKKLAGVDPETYGVWLMVKGDEDKRIGNRELVKLDGPGVERFFTGKDETTEGNL